MTDIRSSFRCAWLSLLAAVLLLPATAAAATYHVGGGNNDFPNLEALRAALAVSKLQNGDQIILYQNDATLTRPLPVQNNARVTISSSEGMKSISGVSLGAGQNIFGNSTDYASLVVKNIKVSGAVSYGAIYVNNSSLAIENSHFDGNSDPGAFSYGGAVYATGNSNIDIKNSSFTNNSAGFTGGAMYVETAAGETANVNISLDGSEGSSSVWSGNTGQLMGIATVDHAIQMEVDGTANLNFDVADGKVIYMDDRISASNAGGGVLNINKTGQGVLRLGTGSPYHGGGIRSSVDTTNFTVSSGKLDMMVGGSVDIVGTGNSRFTVKPGAVVKFASDLDLMMGSYVATDVFVAEDGARMELGNLSKAESNVYYDEKGDTVTHEIDYYGHLVNVTNAGASYMAESFNIDNRLAKTSWEADEKGWTLHIDRIANLGDAVPGLNRAADVYRMSSGLSYLERSILDTIYATGEVPPEFMEYFQSMGGSAILYANWAMRDNWRTLTNAVNRRMTSFFNSDLSLAAIDSRGFASSGAYANSYESDWSLGTGGMWAVAGKRWAKQSMVEDLTGYDYNPYSLALGYDWVNDSLIVGGAAQYDDGKVESGQGNATDVKVRSATLDIYASYAREGYFISGGLQGGYGWNHEDTSYRLLNQYANGSYNSFLVGGNVEFGYMRDFGDAAMPFRLTPYGGVNYAHIGQQGFTESGNSRLLRRFDRGSWDVWELAAGLRFAKPFQVGSFVLIPSLDLSYAYDVGDDTPGTVARFTSFGGDSWDVTSYNNSGNIYRIDLGLTGRFCGRFDVGLAYNLELRKNYIQQQANLNMGMSF